MSRTYRRKNFEQTRNSSWDVRGFKTNGHYTEQEGYYRWWSPSGPVSFRPMDKRERFERNKWYHGESSHANARSPGRGYRNGREVIHRMRCKQEIFKFMKDPENYEPIIYDDADSCLWDWS